MKCNKGSDVVMIVRNGLGFNYFWKAENISSVAINVN